MWPAGSIKNQSGGNQNKNGFLVGWVSDYHNNTVIVCIYNVWGYVRKSQKD